jgi:hypothetical protein
MATTTTPLQPAIQRYLTELKVKLLQTPGATPDEGLADAHEFLQSEWEELCCTGAALSDEDVYRRFKDKFGSPAEVAAGYAAFVGGSAGDADYLPDISETKAARRPARRLRWALVGVLIVLAAATSFVWTSRLQSSSLLSMSRRPVRAVWAGSVVSFTPGNPQPRRSADPRAALGPPDCTNGDVQTESYVTLGDGGALVVEFVGALLCDRDGPDLKIVEIGPLAEPFDVAVSLDAKQWIAVGRAKGAESTIDLAPYVRPRDRFRYVRLIDAKGVKATQNNWPGADIDAVGALHSVPDRQFSAR